jgi:predicted HicB family RNase H-like nuclease
MPITIPKHEPIKKIYVEMVRQIVESEVKNDEDGVEIHEPDSLEDYSGQFKLRIPRSLHRALAEHSQREGISMNQYCVYLLSRNDAMFLK